MISNAVRHGTVTVTVGGAGAGPERLRLWVSDERDGFPPGFADHAFDRLIRPDATRATRGSGLGPALVRAVCQAHHGTATIEQWGEEPR